MDNLLSLNIIAPVYAVAWLVSLNVCLFVFKKWHFQLISWFLIVAAFLGLGYFVDMMTLNKLHEGYQRFEFYTTFIFLSMVFSFPSVAYILGKRGSL